MPLGASTVEWFAAAATAAGALAAAAAVVVALFGPRWHDRRARPLLRVVPEHTKLLIPPWSAALLRLEIHNAPEKKTAEDVEVFASIQTPMADESGLFLVGHLRDASLNFDDPKGEPPGRATTSVPSNHFRPVSFLLLGAPAGIAQRYSVSAREHVGRELPAWVAIPAVYPAAREAVTWFDAVGDPNDITIVVTGANFDAVAFCGQFRMRESQPREEGPPHLSCEWTKALELCPRPGLMRRPRTPLQRPRPELSRS